MNIDGLKLVSFELRPWTKLLSSASSTCQIVCGQIVCNRIVMNSEVFFAKRSYNVSSVESFVAETASSNCPRHLIIRRQIVLSPKLSETSLLLNNLTIYHPPPPHTHKLGRMLAWTIKIYFV